MNEKAELSWNEVHPQEVMVARRDIHGHHDLQ
jgi:hypothetical protein